MTPEHEHEEAERLYVRVRRRLPPGGEDELNELGAAIVIAVVAAILWALTFALGLPDFGIVVVGFFAFVYVFYLALGYFSEA